ncbi:MAG: hypothetical protein ABIH72_04700 [archaeon]
MKKYKFKIQNDECGFPYIDLSNGDSPSQYHATLIETSPEIVASFTKLLDPANPYGEASSLEYKEDIENSIITITINESRSSPMLLGELERAAIIALKETINNPKLQVKELIEASMLEIELSSTN